MVLAPFIHTGVGTFHTYGCWHLSYIRVLAPFIHTGVGTFHTYGCWHRNTLYFLTDRINHDSNKGNVRLLRSGRARRYPSANLYRSSLNLDWVKSKFALLRCSLHEASLHLQAHGPTSADPYVVLRLVPQTKFPGWPKFRTRVQRRTLFPLFDETFDL